MFGTSQYLQTVLKQYDTTFSGLVRYDYIQIYITKGKRASLQTPFCTYVLCKLKNSNNIVLDFWKADNS